MRDFAKPHEVLAHLVYCGNSVERCSNIAFLFWIPKPKEAVQCFIPSSQKDLISQMVAPLKPQVLNPRKTLVVCRPITHTHTHTLTSGSGLRPAIAPLRGSDEEMTKKTCVAAADAPCPGQVAQGRSWTSTRADTLPRRPRRFCTELGRTKSSVFELQVTRTAPSGFQPHHTSAQCHLLHQKLVAGPVQGLDFNTKGPIRKHVSSDLQ